MIVQDLYYIVLLTAAIANIVMSAALLEGNVNYSEYTVYRRSRLLTALTLLVFAAGFVAHSQLWWRETWPVGASALSVSYFHMAAVLFGWSHISLLNPNYLTKSIVVRDVSILVLGLIAYWTSATTSFLTPHFSFLIFFAHALWISYIFYSTLMRVRRMTKQLPQNDDNARWWTDESRRMVIGFQRSIRVSCHLIVFFGLGSIVVTAAFPRHQWPFIVLMALGIAVFCYIYYGLVNYGSVNEAGTNATEDIYSLRKKNKNEIEMKRFRTELQAFFLLAVLLIVPAQNVKADEDVARIYIPTIDMTVTPDGGSGARTFSVITPGQPYITLFIWFLNDNGRNSYWKEAPTLEIDKHTVVLKDLCGDSEPPKVHWSQLTCEDRGKVHYWVRYKTWFDVDKSKFSEFGSENPTIPMLENPEDHYLVVDILFPENEVGDTHDISVYGELVIDQDKDGAVVTYAKDFNGRTTLETVKTKGPFDASMIDSNGKIAQERGMLTWTNPAELTLKSPEMSKNKKDDWGLYQTYLDGTWSDYVKEGKITSKKAYDRNSDFIAIDSVAMAYYYHTAVDWSDTLRHDANSRQAKYEYVKTSFSNSWKDAINNRQLYADGTGYIWGDAFTVIPSGNPGSDGTFTGGSFIFQRKDNQHFTHLALLDAQGDTLTQWRGCSQQETLTIPQGKTVKYIYIECDGLIYGYPVRFVKSGIMDPDDVVYPSELTATPNPWNSEIALKWKANDISTIDLTHKNYDGNYDIYRDGEYIGSVDGSTSSDYSYIDGKAEFGKKYTYTVNYIPKTWTDTIPTPCVTDTVMSTMKHTVSITDFQGTAIADGYKLSWKLDCNLNKTAGYEFKLYRKEITPDMGVPTPADFDGLEPIKIIGVTSTQPTAYTYTDKDVNSTSSYAYMVALDAQETTITATCMPDGHPDRSHPHGMWASCGTHSDYIHIEWEADVRSGDKMVYKLYRHVIAEGEQNINSKEQSDNAHLQWDYLTTIESTEKNVSYDDHTATPGNYYAYAVMSSVNGSSDVTYMGCDGFIRNTGIINGRVSYEGGKYAVEGARIDLLATGAVGNELFNSLSLSGDQSGLRWAISEKQMHNYFRNRPFSVQMYVNPDNGQDGRCLFDINGTVSLALSGDGSADGYALTATAGSTTVTSQLHLKPSQFTSLAFTYDGSGKSWIHLMAPDSLGHIASEQLFDNVALTWTADQAGVMTIGTTCDTLRSMRGYIDDVRLFTRQLSTSDIEKNYNHYMGGTESDLVAYWSFDEPISTLRRAYDYSSTGSTANENHAKVMAAQRNSDIRPTTEQLALFSLTDTDGHYTIQSIPYANSGNGIGTGYDIIPSKNAHQFDPVSRHITVSADQTTFDDINFTDNSKYTVRGFVYYENTTYPVKGCRFLIDGTEVRTINNDVVTSDDKGEYRFEIPIGNHVVSVVKDGHTFLNGGHYPATGTFNFNKDVSHLTFFDTTKAIVTGRVVGGAIEKEKPLGLGLSTATVGSATLRLLTSSSMEDARNMNVRLDSISGEFIAAADSLYYEQANPDRVQSIAYIGNKQDGQGDVKTIYIKTDPRTGEFAVKLPPVPYYIETIVDNNTEATTALKEKTLLDCSDVTRWQRAAETQTSSAGKVDTLATFDYNTAFVQTYFAAPAISVVQNGSNEGVFGEKNVPAGELGATKDTYTETGGVVTYNYGVPIFTQGMSYRLDVSAYEQYFNYDADAEHPIETRIPSTEGLLTISNPMTQDADTVALAPLDSLGRYVYTFQPLKVNEVAPYTQPLSFALTIGENVYPWNWTYRGKDEPLQCLVLGTKVTGNTSVTAGPDALINIIRDPFGSNSSVTWEKGSELSYGFDVKLKLALNWANTMENEGGLDVTMASGVGTYIFTGSSLAAGVSEGFSWKNSLDVNGGSTWSFENTQSVSTSSEPHFDGPNGDVFVGMSTSFIYGDGLQVMLVDDQAGDYRIGTQPTVAVTQGMDTKFAYSQDYIITQLIPNFKRLREVRLRQVSQEYLETARSQFHNDTDSIVYMTSLTPDDPRFGTSLDDPVWGDDAVSYYKLNWGPDSLYYYGPSYTAFLPVSGKYADEEESWDAIRTINSNIQIWEGFLATNEESKVKAINREPKTTISFSGTTLSYDHIETTTGSEGISFETAASVYQKYKVGAKIKNTATNTASGSYGIEYEQSFNPSLIFGQTMHSSYTVNIADNVANNTHEMAVYDADDGFGYIFRQVSGQTSCPYEGLQLTKYYEPGNHELSKGTTQIEVPHIDCDQRIVTAADPDEGAFFNLKLSNPSVAQVYDTTENDFILQVVSDKWGSLAEVKFNGEEKPSSLGVSLSPGDSVMITMKVKPKDKEVIHLDSLHLCLYSECQSSISDDIIVAAHFQPQAEKIELASSRTLVNTATDSTLVLTATGYKPTSTILNAVKLQQRKQGSPDWATLHSWVTGVPAGDNESALVSERIDTLIDMHSNIAYPDATYEFRAVTDCTVAGESVLGESETITVIKDVTLPRPLYLPEPADGILSPGDNITVTFNEDIYSQSLNKPDNFSLQAVLNTDSVAHEVALRLDGATTPAATTQADLMLGNTSFTVCTWLKASGTPGTILRHGEGANALRLNLDADGHLTAYITDENGMAQPYTSPTTIPHDEWVYLGVSYDVNAGTLSAHYTSANNEDVLIGGVSVGQHATSQGRIYLGENLHGAMHELSFYSTSLDWTSIKMQMYEGKSHSKPSLVGYWHLDEGHGTKSEDLARSRHMLIASPTAWYLENENIALALGGTASVAIPLGELSAKESTSFLIEAWALDSGSPAESASLFSLDNGGKLDLIVTGDGNLKLVTDSTTVTTTVAPFTPNEWHHVALNVLRGTASEANLIVDGTSVLTLPTSAVPALEGARLWLGRGMTGAMDEVRLWHGTNTQATIVDRMYTRIDATDERGLVGYYPFEKSTYDEYDQRVYGFSLENFGYEHKASTALVTDGGAVAPQAAGSAPGLKSAPHKTLLDFDFVADERTVSITLDHSPQALEGCIVNTTLHDFYDMHTNVGNPVTWSFVVRQNPLTWNTTEVSTKVSAGNGGTFTATLTNMSGTTQDWSFVELPSWLTANMTSGTILANQTQDIEFTVPSGIAIGKYFATVSVRAAIGIDTPLDISVSAEGQRPDWSKPEGYDDYMTVVAQIKLDGIVSTDPDDMLGAFTDPADGGLGECLGAAQPTYNESRDAYYVRLMVYGNSTIVGDTVRFRIYDASTGLTYPLTNVSTPVLFAIDGSAGSFDNPVIVENTDKVLQTLPLYQGTNWVSLYLAPDKNQVSTLFQPVTGQISAIDFADGLTVSYDGTAWSADHPVGTAEMMKVSMNAQAELPVVGDAVNPADYPFTIKPGNNWIGVPSGNAMPIGDAFTALSPVEGDQVKGQTGFSIYENTSWVGDLQFIEPGQGYVYTSGADHEKTFCFPSSVPARQGVRRLDNLKGIAANYRYAHNMALVCTVHNEYGEPTDVTSVEVHDATGELRGRTTRLFRDSLLLLVVSGQTEGEPLVVRANVRGADDGQYATLLHFKRDHLTGTLRRPLVIGAATTDIAALVFAADSQLAVYNIAGLTVYLGPASQFDKHQLLPDAVYIIRETTSAGQVNTYKAKLDR